MTPTDPTREEDLRQLLTDAIEVQLAALKAGISFWTEWIEQTSEFVNTATKALSSISTDDPQTKDVILELVDAGRASVRGITEIPRHTAAKFIEELDKLDQQNQARRRPTAKAAPRAAAAPKRGTGASRPKRAGRVKA